MTLFVQCKIVNINKEIIYYKFIACLYSIICTVRSLAVHLFNGLYACHAPSIIGTESCDSYGDHIPRAVSVSGNYV